MLACDAGSDPTRRNPPRGIYEAPRREHQHAGTGSRRAVASTSGCLRQGRSTSGNSKRAAAKSRWESTDRSSSTTRRWSSMPRWRAVQGAGGLVSAVSRVLPLLPRTTSGIARTRGVHRRDPSAGHGQKEPLIGRLRIFTLGRSRAQYRTRIHRIETAPRRGLPLRGCRFSGAKGPQSAHPGNSLQWRAGGRALATATSVETDDLDPVRRFACRILVEVLERAARRVDGVDGNRV